jgi:hypothetical protein
VQENDSGCRRGRARVINAHPPAPAGRRDRSLLDMRKRWGAGIQEEGQAFIAPAKFWRGKVGREWQACRRAYMVRSTFQSALINIPRFASIAVFRSPLEVRTRM